jgi:hypothetical protein
MNLNEIAGLHRSMISIADPKEYQQVVQTILANVPNMLSRLYTPQVVIAAQTADLRLVYFGTFRNVSFVRNQILINDAIRSIGLMDVNNGLWYIHGDPYQTVSIEPYRQEAEYHQNLIQL